MKEIIVNLELQNDNYGPEDPRLFVQNYEGVPDMTVGVPAQSWRELDDPVDIEVTVRNKKTEKP